MIKSSWSAQKNQSSNFKIGMISASLKKERHNEGTSTYRKCQGPEYRWRLTLKAE